MGIFDKLMESDLTGQNKENISKLDIAIGKIASKGFNMSEMEGILRNDSKYQLVESVAGSGKTTTLNFKLLVDSYSGRSWGKTVWVNTFLRTGADALKDDFFEKIRELGMNIPLNNIQFSTIHSEFYKVLKSIGLKINIISPDVDRAMKNSVSKDLMIGNHPGYLTNSEIQIFDTIETFINSHSRDITTKELIDLGLDELSANEQSIKDAVRILRERRFSAEVYSFDDLQIIMYRFLVLEPNPTLRNLVKNRYQYIYLDEFQDTSRIQYEIMKVYFENAEQVVFVGDSDQSIYSWRGADIDIITKDLMSDYDIDLQKLTVNYRVPSNILRPIARSIVLNENRIPKEIESARQGGILDIHRFDKKSKMDKFTVASLFEMQESEEYKDIAVLASTNLDITELALNLLILGKGRPIDFSIGGTVQDLNRKIYKDIWSLAHIFSSSPNENLRNNIRFLSNNSIYKNKCIKIEEFLRNSGQSLTTITKATLFDLTQRNRSVVTWYENLMSPDGKYVKNGMKPIDGLVCTYEYLLIKLVIELEENPRLKGIIEDKASKIILFLKLIQEFEVESIEDFLNHIQMLNKEIKEHYNRKNTKIILTTPFDFKGKEADLVYVYNDVDGKFPRAKSAESNFEEERRLHYIAGTRARKSCIYTTIDGSESPFLLEMVK